jgi:hypothetical protein
VSSDRKRSLAFIRAARAAGADTVNVYNDGDRINESQDEKEVLASLLACDEVHAVCSGGGKRLGTFFFVLGNGDDGPIADYTDNEWSGAIYNDTMGEQ